MRRWRDWKDCSKSWHPIGVSTRPNAENSWTIIGIAWSLIIIAIAWLFYRPLLGISLLVLAGFLVWVFAFKGKDKLKELAAKAKNKSAAPAPAPAEAPAPAPTEAE